MALLRFPIENSKKTILINNFVRIKQLYTSVCELFVNHTKNCKYKVRKITFDLAIFKYIQSQLENIL